MAQRKKSTDGGKDTEKLFGEDGQVSQSGRAGGRLPRDIGTRDILKRATERPSGATRVQKSDEDPKGDRS